MNIHEKIGHFVHLTKPTLSIRRVCGNVPLRRGSRFLGLILGSNMVMWDHSTYNVLSENFQGGSHVISLLQNEANPKTNVATMECSLHHVRTKAFHKFGNRTRWCRLHSFIVTFVSGSAPFWSSEITLLPSCYGVLWIVYLWVSLIAAWNLEAGNKPVRHHCRLLVAFVTTSMREV